MSMSIYITAIVLTILVPSYTRHVVMCRISFAGG
jgi:hypothetical protein